MDEHGHTGLEGLLQSLVEIRVKRRDSRRLETEASELAAAVVPAAHAAGVPVVRIAKLTGMSRPAIYRLLDGSRPPGAGS